jgi:3-dehydroquinate synthase
MSPASETVHVNLGDRSYDIVVAAGALAQLGALLRPQLARPFVVIVTDENVGAHHLAAAQEALEGEGISSEAIELPPGEATKSFAVLEDLCGRLLDLGVERSDMVIALGGGVIGDLTGFAAAILRRGVRFVQVPTTLLAQVDSSVGGKTAINVAQGKNLIGAFHQPSLVVADVALLDTLPRRQLLAGYAEVVKYAVLGDAAFFGWLEEHGEALIAGGSNGAPLRTEAVARSVRAKAAIVARDEREAGERALLNLGHTFGHALEAATGYSDRLLHGEGVAIGMGLALDLSAELGFADPAEAQRLRAHLRNVGLPASLADIEGPPLSADALLTHMAQDKKVTRGELNLVLARGIGEAFTQKNVAAGKIRDLLARSGATPSGN